jgi:hypothetical protein
MGEYFLVCGLVALGITIGFVFFIIPGIVIGISWCFAVLITVDKGKNPSEAITLSNNATYGNKRWMFCIYLLICLAYTVIYVILTSILWRVPALLFILSLAASIFLMVIAIGLQASLYKQLTDGI